MNDSPVLAVQACAGYFVISVLNAEIIAFVKTLYFISHKISTSHTTCYMVDVFCFIFWIWTFSK